MKALKRIVVAGVAALALFGMTGCSSVNEDGTNSAITTYVVTFPDNSKVDCLYSIGMGHSGVKCMWDMPAASTEINDTLVASIQSAGGATVRCVIDEYGVMDCDDTAK